MRIKNKTKYNTTNRACYGGSKMKIINGEIETKSYESINEILDEIDMEE